MKSQVKTKLIVVISLLTLPLIAAIIYFSQNSEPPQETPPGPLSKFDESWISSKIFISIEEEFLTAGTESLTLFLNNVTNEVVATSQNIVIEKEVQGTWYRAGDEIIYFDAYLVNPGISSFTTTLNPYLYSPLDAGHYRLLLSPTGVGQTSVLEFTVR